MEGRTDRVSVSKNPLDGVIRHTLTEARWIDACMRQLKNEGWIHHLARHSVACFITRGQCYISWERGMEVFDGGCRAYSTSTRDIQYLPCSEWLIDWDPASNVSAPVPSGCCV